MIKIDCDCYKCDPSSLQEYQTWENSVKEYAKKNKLCEFDVAHILAHTPIKFLRLPCIKKNNESAIV